MRFFGKAHLPSFPRSPEPKSPEHFLWRMAKIYGALMAFLFLVALPYSFWWLYASGDVALERACERQGREFAIFGSGVSQDFVDYKLNLYREVRPTIVALGSSRVMQFRSHVFDKKFLNMGGVAGNLPVLRSTLDAMLMIHKPEAIILGLDFWWFTPKWNPDPFKEEPPTSGSYTYGIDSLQKPWAWILQGKLSLRDFFAPLAGLIGAGFRENRFGIMAQQTDDGFGSDGSWYYTAEITGQKKPFDYQFQDTLTQVHAGIKAFSHFPEAKTPSERHLDAFAEIYCRLQARGIRTYVFIAPLADRVYRTMREMEDAYPHLFTLANSLRARGINVIDLSDPRKLGSGECEFVDGFHGGEVTYLRILRSLTDHWSSLLGYVNQTRLNKSISEWQNHAMIYDERVTKLLEQDFMDFDCKKRSALSQKP